MDTISVDYMKEQLRLFRKFHPFGCVARPLKHTDGSINYAVWECAVAGKRHTFWEGGLFKFRLLLNNYPRDPPLCRFSPPIFHPNIDGSGFLSIPMLSTRWKTDITIRQIIWEIDKVIAEPYTFFPPGNEEALRQYRRDKKSYYEGVRMNVTLNPISKTQARLDGEDREQIAMPPGPDQQYVVRRLFSPEPVRPRRVQQQFVCDDDPYSVVEVDPYETISQILKRPPDRSRLQPLSAFIPQAVSTNNPSQDIIRTEVERPDREANNDIADVRVPQRRPRKPKGARPTRRQPKRPTRKQPMRRAKTVVKRYGK